MTYQDAFNDFWEHVKSSVQDESFAKLTMAKTIGNPPLKNIFMRPMEAKSDTKMLVKLHYNSKETEDEEKELRLTEAFEFIKSYLKSPFYTVILFTITKDLTFKINKKENGSLTEGLPTFRNVIPLKDDAS